MVVKSEKKGIYYILVLIRYRGERYYTTMEKKPSEIEPDKNYIYCCEEMAKYINKLDVKNVLVHPTFNKVNFDSCYYHMDIDFLAKILESNIDRFSNKNIYILVVENVGVLEHELTKAIYDMKRGRITPEKYKHIYMENQMKKSLSYTNSLLKIAKMETRYKEKSFTMQLKEDMYNSSCFFDEYISRYSGTDSELARNANIDNSTVSKIKGHAYKAKSKNVIIALAIALDFTVDDRKRFINSAGFSYPINEHDRFIEQQLRKKRYTRVIDFNNDIMDEYPDFVIKTRSSRKRKESDK